MLVFKYNVLFKSIFLMRHLFLTFKNEKKKNPKKPQLPKAPGREKMVGVGWPHGALSCILIHSGLYVVLQHPTHYALKPLKGKRQGSTLVSLKTS